MSDPGEGRFERFVLIEAPPQLSVVTLSRELMCARLGMDPLSDSACPLRFLFQYLPNTGAAVKNRFVPCPCGDVASHSPSNQLRQQLVLYSRWRWVADGIVNWLSFVSRIPSWSTNRKM